MEEGVPTSNGAQAAAGESVPEADAVANVGENSTIFMRGVGAPARTMTLPFPHAARKHRMPLARQQGDPQEIAAGLLITSNFHT